MEILEKIPISKSCSDIKFDKNSSKIILSYFQKDFLDVVDTKSNEKVQTIEIPNISSIMIDDKSHQLFVYSLKSAIENKWQPALFVYDTNTFERITTITGKKFFKKGRSEIKFNYCTNRIYLEHFWYNCVNVINKDFKFETPLEIKKLGTIEIDKKNNQVLVGSENTISIYDGSNHILVDSIEIKNNLWGSLLIDSPLTLNSTENLLYVWEMDASQSFGDIVSVARHSLFVFDYETKNLINSIKFGIGCSYCINPMTSSVFVRNTSKNTVTKYDKYCKSNLGQIQLSKKSWWKRLSNVNMPLISIDPNMSRIFTTNDENLVIIQE